MITLYTAKTASKGITMGKAYVLQKPVLNADQHHIHPDQIAFEITKYQKAVKEAKVQLKAAINQSDLFQAHLALLSDSSFHNDVIDKISNQSLNAQYSLEKTVMEYCNVFLSMEDQYIRERMDDLVDIRNRLMRILKGISEVVLSDINERVIIVAENLVLSDSSYLNLDYVQGFVTEQGGVSSHVSIIARSLELPALVGMKDLLKNVKSGDELILDATHGKLIINPDEATRKSYEALKKALRKKQKELEEQSRLPACTLDNKCVKLCANVGSLEDVKKAVRCHIDGIGLFRTEFLYMNRNHFPTEEEQFEVYKEAATLCNSELVIRTLDIGGDKALPYYPFEKEDNPFLGWRAIRISLELREVFKTQLRAILRASKYGNIKLMYPMITSLEELQEANVLLEECKEELTKAGIPFNPSLEKGMMVETPAAVICAEQFARHVDFFSIGTNDLTQYLLAVDRGNSKISSMFDSFHPAVIQSIKKVIDAGHKQGIKVAMCGDMAGDENATALLLGLGLDEFSMAVGDIANIKNIIRGISYENAKTCVASVLQCESAKAVRECIKAPD